MLVFVVGRDGGDLLLSGPAGEEPALFHCRKCFVCGVESEVILPKSKVEAWLGGDPIQSVFPELTLAERELLISGTHEACWAVMFPPEEDEDDGVELVDVPEVRLN